MHNHPPEHLRREQLRRDRRNILRLLHHWQMPSPLDGDKLGITAVSLSHILHRLGQDAIATAGQEDALDLGVLHLRLHVVLPQRAHALLEALEAVFDDHGLDPLALVLHGAAVVALLDEPSPRGDFRQLVADDLVAALGRGALLLRHFDALAPGLGVACGALVVGVAGDERVDSVRVVERHVEHGRAAEADADDRGRLLHLEFVEQRNDVRGQ